MLSRGVESHGIALRDDILDDGPRKLLDRLVVEGHFPN
jgi:hypothetical protein